MTRHLATALPEFGVARLRNGRLSFAIRASNANGAHTRWSDQTDTEVS